MSYILKPLKKFIYVLAKDIDSKRKFEIKAKKSSAWKRPIYWVTLNQAVVSKMLRITKYFSVHKILVPRLAYSHYYEPR